MMKGIYQRPLLLAKLIHISLAIILTAPTVIASELSSTEEEYCAYIVSKDGVLWITGEKDGGPMSSEMLNRVEQTLRDLFLCSQESLGFKEWSWSDDTYNDHIREVQRGQIWIVEDEYNFNFASFSALATWMNRRKVLSRSEDYDVYQLFRREMFESRQNQDERCIGWKYVFNEGKGDIPDIDGAGAVFVAANFSDDQKSVECFSNLFECLQKSSQSAGAFSRARVLYPSCME